MPLRSSFQAPTGYYTDALNFSGALEESQRAAIKFEERRCWVQLQKQYGSSARKLMPVSTQSLVCEAESPSYVTAADPADTIALASYASPPLPDSSIEDVNQQYLSHKHLRELREGVYLLAGGHLKATQNTALLLTTLRRPNVERYVILCD
ncbi:hypothetical protein LSCM1_06810 [Leishmania martiniquensis]|uniref:Uncharacterized protein n=1 Tax=Leishmania martiniquensis TaxID=1580590 RepID=A0A836KMQ6_9TRYP|nr:hypothetical protein LSCM1_06810 [Leishmania martiniquensis]